MGKKSLTFGERLRVLREERELSLAKLADAIGVSIVHMSAIERGKKNPPSPSQIIRLLERLGQPELFSEMMVLAARSRKSIEISVEGKSDATTNLLVALARRCDQADEIEPDIIEQIKRLLESRDD